ncbi:hypothetical protein PTI98_013585 [Pleurotus ostreatus]|nr:hypothetical protein PTI98_013585 [Pleurotus ostreatus]
MSASVCTRELADADGKNGCCSFIHLLPNLYELGVTHGDEAKVGYYVGLLESLFFVTRAITVLHWSRMSDWIGRKPVILRGLLGLSASMSFFGPSKTFLGLILRYDLYQHINACLSLID